MKYIIIILLLLCNSLISQDIALKHFGDLVDNNNYTQILSECYISIDTAKLDANKQLANHYISVVLYRQNKSVEGLEYAFKALKFDGPYTDRILNNIGCLYVQLKQYDNALSYLYKRLALVKGSGDEHINTLGNIAVVEVMKGNFKAAKSYLDTAFNITPKDKLDVLYLQYGDLYFYQSDFKLAVPFYMKSLATNPLDLSTKEATYQGLAESYVHLNNADSSIRYFELYNNVKDSQREKRASKDINELFIKYETKDKERQLEVSAAKVGRQQKYIGLGLFAGLILLVILVVIYRLYSLVKAKKHIVEEKNKVITQKNKEIEDSIIYAKGIQQAILPIINDNNIFVIYQPKDIVSGDFYWIAEKNSLKYYAVADCTGHGVPGALMSMLCSQLLDEAIESTDSPVDILKYVQKGLDFKMKTMGRNDGMEVGLISIDKEGNRIYFSGIGRALYLVYNNQLEAYKNEINFEIKEGMMLYMTSDGYYDQFGMNNKKLGSKRLKEKLLQISIYELAKQKEILENFFIDWKGNENQVDDVLVMGIKT